MDWPIPHHNLTTCALAAENLPGGLRQRSSSVENLRLGVVAHGLLTRRAKVPLLLRPITLATVVTMTYDQKYPVRTSFSKIVAIADDTRPAYGVVAANRHGGYNLIYQRIAYWGDQCAKASDFRSCKQLR
jgi:hypothetical protein